MAEIEHVRKSGGNGFAYGDLIISTARRLAREGRVTLVRFPDAKRLFFRPLEPFLVDGSTGRKQRARVERSSLDAIYFWLSRDLIPGRFGDEFAALDRRLREGDTEAAEQAIAGLRADAAAAIAVALGQADASERERMRLVSHVGGAQVFEDARDMVTVIGHARLLDRFAARLPIRIAEFDEGHQKHCLALLDALVDRAEDVTIFALAALMARLDRPAQIVRLAVRSAGTDVAAKLRSAPFAGVADLILHDIARIAALISQKFDGKVSLAEIRRLLQQHYALAHGLRTETEIAHNDEWALRLARASSLISERLGPVIASAPRHIKAALVPRREAQVHDPDEADIEAAEFSIGLMQEVRPFLSELALNDIVARTGKEVDQHMDLIGDFVVDRLRTADPADLDKASALLRGTVRLTRLALGPELADLLSRSGASAIQSVTSRRAAGA